MATKRFLALDIGASSIKLAEFLTTGQGNLTLVNFGYAALEMDLATEEDSKPFIVAALKKLMAEHKFKARKVAISVSGQQVLTRFMKLPATEESKIRQMVRYEAAQNVPFPIEEVVWDYQVIGAKTETEMEVVLVAIKNDIIEGFKGCAEEVGLVVEVVDVSPIATYNAVLFNYETTEGCTLLLDIGARTTNLIFIEAGKIFTRSVPIAGNTITQSVAQEFEIPFAQAEKMKIEDGFVGLGGAYEEPESENIARLCKIIRNVMTRLHADVSRSINFYKNQQGGSAPKRVLLSGGSSIIPYADHFFKEKMDMEVEYFNPFKNVPIQVPPEDLEKVAHNMGETVGLGLRLVGDCPIEVNLVPPSVARQRQFVKKIPYFAISMVGILLIVLCWWLYFWKTTGKRIGHRDEVAKEVADLSKVQSEIDVANKLMGEVQMRSKQLQLVIDARYFWVQFFSDLHSRVPANVWITQLIPMSDGTHLNYSGTAPVTALPAIRGRVRLSILSGGPASDAGGASSPTAGKGINEFEIKGLCLNDPSGDVEKAYKPIEDFRKNLLSSPYIAEATTRELSPLEPLDWTFSFGLSIRLKKPIPY